MDDHAIAQQFASTRTQAVYSAFAQISEDDF